jgi:pyrroline-5-carboxylate reductase
MKAQRMKVAIVGAGNLGGAVAAGLLASGLVAPQELSLVTASAASADALRDRLPAGVIVGTDAAAAVERADVVMLGVKPPKIAGVLRELAPVLAPGAVVVSLAAGVRLAELVAAAPAGQPVVRVMTNTPVRVRAATTMIAVAEGVKHADVARIVSLCDGLGATHVIDESLMDAATALAGSGPAYLFLLVECLRDAGVALGLDRTTAQEMASTAMAGAALLLEDGAADPVALRAAVTSPGGMTAAAVAVFEDAALRETVEAALAAAVARAEELAAG